MDRCRNGPGFHNDIDGNSTIQELLIPASKVGLVIGKGGETIKQLQVREHCVVLSWPGLAHWRAMASLPELCSHETDPSF